MTAVESRPDLAAFLLARLGEDYEIAYGAAPSPWREGGGWDGTMSGARTVLDKHGGRTADCYYGGTYGHVLHFDPTRIILEIEARRAIVQRCLDVIASFGDWDAGAAKAAGGRVLWTDVNRRERSHAHSSLYTLAAVYADHPDYRDEWRP